MAICQVSVKGREMSEQPFSLTPCFSWVSGDARAPSTVSTVLRSKTVETVEEGVALLVTSMNRGVNEIFFSSLN